MATRRYGSRPGRARAIRGRRSWSPRPGRIGAASVGLALLCAWAAPSAAQQPPPGPLSTLPGQNAAQRDMAGSIDRVCPALVDRRDAQVERSAQEAQLQETCTSMIHTARQLQGIDAPTDQSRGISTDETNAALQSIHGEELQTPQLQISQIRDVQVGAVLTRLQAVRQGLAGPGLSLAGLNLDFGDTVLLAGADGALRLHREGESAPTGEHGDAVLVGQGGDLGGFAGGRLGLFVTGSVKFGEKDSTDTVQGFDFTTLGITVGADYRLTERLVLGGAFGYSRFDADFDETAASPGGQDLESDNYLLSLFGSYAIDGGFFLDGIATIGYSNYDSTRRIVIPSDTGVPPVDLTARGDFDAFQYGFAANAGYDTFVGPVRLTPVVQVEFVRAHIDGFTESGAGGLNLEFDDETAKSLVLRPGLQAAYPISVPFGVISPYVRAEYIREFLDNDGTAVRYAADPTGLSAFNITAEDGDRNYGTLGGGVTATLRGGWSLFADYETVIGLSDFDVHRVAVGLRKELL